MPRNDEELQFHFPGLADEIDAKAVVRLFLDAAKARRLIKAARGEQLCVHSVISR